VYLRRKNIQALAPSPCKSLYGDGAKREKLRLFPKLISIEPGKRVELRITYLPIQTLITTYDKRLSPDEVDTSQVHCLKLSSSNGPVNSDKALEFLKAHQLPKVKAITFNNLTISLELIDYLNFNFKLESLSLVQSVFHENNRYSEERFDLLFLREFLFELDCTMRMRSFSFPNFKGLVALSIYLSGKIIEDPNYPNYLTFNANHSHELRDVNIECHPSFDGILCFKFPRKRCINKLNCIARPTQLEFFATTFDYHRDLTYVKLHRDIMCNERRKRYYEYGSRYSMYTEFESNPCIYPYIELVDSTFSPMSAPYLNDAISYYQKQRCEQQRKKRNYNNKYARKIWRPKQPKN